MKRLLLCMAALSAPVTLNVRADDESATKIAQAKANEQRLRDSLRTVTQQLGTAEAEKATLLAGQTERDEKIAALEKQVAALTKRSNDGKAEAAQTAARLQASLESQKQETARLAATLEKWKAAYQKAADLVQKSAAAQAKLEAANIALERKADDRERQNLELYRTAREILQRYTGYSTGRALAAREPFTGIAKARLEEQIQDYADKIEDHKVPPAPSDGKPSTVPSKPLPAKKS